MEAELARLKAENDALRLQLGQAGGEFNVDAVITSLIEQQQKRYEAPKGKYELRSDTLTKPTAAMRAAIATSEVGDAVWGTDPTVKALEEYVATLCGKEAALFVPSGVMGNLICVMCHCDARVSEVILGDRAHQMLYETSNLASVAGVQTRTVPNNADGTLPLEALKNAFRGLDQHWPTTRAVLLENTHNFTGGKVLPLDYIRQVRKICDSHIYPVALHCDGARAWHAAVALGVSMKELLECFDTASLCLSKALGAPVGSVIVGPKALIEGRAKRLVKMLGGGMRQTGIIASAGLYAVKNHFSRLQDDHAMAKALFVALSRVGVSAIEPQTNILIWNTPKPGSASRVIELCAAEGIMIGSIGSSLLRAIPHLGCGVSLEDVDRIAAVVAKAHAEVMSP